MYIFRVKWLVPGLAISVTPQHEIIHKLIYRTKWLNNLPS